MHTNWCICHILFWFVYTLCAVLYYYIRSKIKKKVEHIVASPFLCTAYTQTNDVFLGCYYHHCAAITITIMIAVNGVWCVAPAEHQILIVFLLCYLW